MPGRRLLAVLLGPVRFVRRRPWRVGLVAAGLLLVAAAGGYGWFHATLDSARAESDRGHHRAGVERLMKCMAVWPDHPDARLLAARIARRAGEWDRADEHLNWYAARHGEDDRLALEKVLLRAARGELEAVAGPLATYAQGPEAGETLEATATGLLYRFRWAEAARVLDAKLAAEPDSPGPLLLRGKVYEQQQDLARAGEAYTRLVDRDPDHDEARLRLAAIHVANRSGADALTHLDLLRRRLPDNPEVAVQRVRALDLAGRTDDARAALDECLQRFPNLPEAVLERGRVALEDGDLPTAIDLLTRGLNAQPGNSPSRVHLVAALRKAGRTAEADTEQAKADRLTADFEELVTLINGPLQTDPRNPDVLHKIGTIAVRSGQFSEAVRWLQAAVAADPGHVPSHQLLAVLYQQSGDAVLAARHRGLARKATPP